MKKIKKYWHLCGFSKLGQDINYHNFKDANKQKACCIIATLILASPTE